MVSFVNALLELMPSREYSYDISSNIFTVYTVHINYISRTGTKWEYNQLQTFEFRSRRPHVILYVLHNMISCFPALESLTDDGNANISVSFRM